MSEYVRWRVEGGGGGEGVRVGDFELGGDDG